MNIIDHDGLDLFINMDKEGDPEVIITNILFTQHESYKVASDTAKSIFNHQGKNRSDLGFDSDEDEDNELDRSPVDHLAISMEDELYKLLITEINNYMKSLESSSKSVDQNKLKALVIKFLNINLYSEYDLLYKPSEYESLINEYLNLPNLHKDYYLKVIESIKLMDPESSILPKLEEVGNPLLLTESTNIREIRDMEPEVREVFNDERSNLRKILNPEISELRSKFNMPHTTYIQNISKGLNELSVKLEEEELMSRFNKLILS